MSNKRMSAYRAQKFLSGIRLAPGNSIRIFSNNKNWIVTTVILLFIIPLGSMLFLMIPGKDIPGSWVVDYLMPLSMPVFNSLGILVIAFRIQKNDLFWRMSYLCTMFLMINAGFALYYSVHQMPTNALAPYHVVAYLVTTVVGLFLVINYVRLRKMEQLRYKRQIVGVISNNKMSWRDKEEVLTGLVKQVNYYGKQDWPKNRNQL